MISGGGPGHGKRYVSVTVTNQGRRTATISRFGWRFGLPPSVSFGGLKRRHFIGPDHEGTTLPAKLEDGEYAMFSVPLEQFATALLNGCSKSVLLPFPYLRFMTMQAFVPTTAGKTFYATVSKDLRQELTKRVHAKEWE